jgi:hypothetical protein
MHSGVKHKMHHPHWTLLHFCPAAHPIFPALLLCCLYTLPAHTHQTLLLCCPTAFLPCYLATLAAHSLPTHPLPAPQSVSSQKELAKLQEAQSEMTTKLATAERELTQLRSTSRNAEFELIGKQQVRSLFCLLL